MTSVLEPTDRPRPLVVTPEEYESLPENRLLELVDGVVHAMTPATRLHQEITDSLKSALRRLSPKEVVVVREQELRMHDDLRRVPDLMVIMAVADGRQRYWFAPAETLLVVEVVSPHTETVDRLHKPAEYAAAGVEHYWRIETQPAVEVHTHQLGPPGTYTFTGKFVEGDVVAAPGLPWAKVAVADLAM
jgi:Uma2 family endonuclease